ncbi:16S rRNA (uracil1498-N3)-methyltransferase [Chitinivorax tropicus]|uniref:Ribosomal RNA small subunit methyltransferase E n=1 Tax=Chitinivorax tropicus TaxID=714531 RepID=A0A840MKK4_9PROT|nr:16S rRNA (uracil(1498)-N(3))-methyltransferase [Chitinivorax tropicus]MBB5017242.1 16S rRNA (uracil1498-N3)-methyltransferase [Chitinivorax tropicus]
MPRFYIDTPLATDILLTLPEAVCRHIQVLRLQQDDTITLFDGSGSQTDATIVEMGKKRVSVQTHTLQQISRESPLHITLVQAVSSGDRMDYTLQKAVELGVSRIIPVISERSVVRLQGERAEKRIQHWQGVIISACEQCGRNTVPEVSPLQPFAQWVKQPHPAGVNLMLSPQGTRQLKQLELSTQLSLLAGPEGGLTASEEAVAIEQGWQPISLGPRILRTETAAVATMAALQALWGDM